MERRLEAFGWSVFSCGSALFVVQSAVSGDVWALLASVGFLMGCIAFLVS